MQGRDFGYDIAVRAAGLLGMLATAACAREPAEAVCPELAAGDLVVTEVRGPQSPADAGGAWVEIYNASGRTLDLLGVKVWFRDIQDKDKYAGIPILVRRSLLAAPASYTVLGLFDDMDHPAHVDYGFLGDFNVSDRSWVIDGLIYVDACDAQIDASTQFKALPRMGTFSLGGMPDANRNDQPTAWCTDATKVGTIFPGSPRSPNIACP